MRRTYVTLIVGTAASIGFSFAQDIQTDRMNALAGEEMGRNNLLHGEAACRPGQDVQLGRNLAAAFIAVPMVLAWSSCVRRIRAYIWSLAAQGRNGQAAGAVEPERSHHPVC